MKHPTASGIYAKICQVWRVRVWIVSLFLILIYIFIFRFKLVQKPEARFVKKVKMKWQPLQFAAIWYRKVPKRRIPGYSNIPTPLEKRPLSKSSWIFGLPKLISIFLEWTESVSTRIVMMFLPWISELWFILLCKIFKVSDQHDSLQQTIPPTQFSLGAWCHAFYSVRKQDG